MMLQEGRQGKEQHPRAARFSRIETVAGLCRRPIYENDDVDYLGVKL